MSNKVVIIPEEEDTAKIKIKPENLMRAIEPEEDKTGPVVVDKNLLSELRSTRKCIPTGTDRLLLDMSTKVQKLRAFLQDRIDRKILWKDEEEEYKQILEETK